MSAVGDLDFSGKVVLVVGGSSGIGNGIARAFRERGADVHVTGTRASAEDYKADDGSDLAGLAYAQLDFAAPGAVAALDLKLTRLDVLVLAQGAVLYKRGEYSPEGFRKILEINLASMMDCCMALQPMLKSSRGAIITISSTAAFHATRGNPAYNASKSGLVGLTRTLAEAWAADGIRVNGIAPGFVATKMTKVTTDNPERLQGALNSIPLGRLGTPDDMAGAALFLASPLAAYIVGQTIIVDGGLILR
jgi:3-oxoacyl-[acyl-carrier protein] reductase